MRRCRVQNSSMSPQGLERVESWMISEEGVQNAVIMADLLVGVHEVEIK